MQTKKIAGIDFGSTLTKVVWKTDELNFASTADKSLEEIFEVLRKDNVTEIYAAGINTPKVPDDFKLITLEGDKIENEAKLQAEGAKYLLKGKYVHDFILASIGTGISYTFVGKDTGKNLGKDIIERFPIGNSIGGGFFYGLGQLFGAKDFKEMLALADKGTSLDLLIKDKLPEKEGTFQGELAIANFGKARVNSKKEDLYATLLSTIAITVTRDVLVREMIAASQKVFFPKTSQNIVYVGSLVSSSLKLREELTKYSQMIGRKAHFPEKGEFSLALGIYLNNSEEEKLNSLFEVIQDEYDAGKGEVEFGSMGSSGVGYGAMKACEKIVEKINLLYKTNYDLEAKK